jgi:putative transposase
MRQLEFNKTHWRYRFSHGGKLRQKRLGRGARPLSSKGPLHLVLKARRERVKQGFRASPRFLLIHRVLRKYAYRFYIKVEQVSVQGDHLHLLIRTTRRSNYLSFFRVLAGQIAQQLEREGFLSVVAKREGVTDTPRSADANLKVTDTPAAAGAATTALWLYRPFTRVVRGYRAYRIVRDYIQLNEKEARGEIAYRPQRLKGLSLADWQILWT